jgi:dipeptidyl-peptidase-4
VQRLSSFSPLASLIANNNMASLSLACVASLLLGSTAAIDTPRAPVAPAGSGNGSLTFNNTVIAPAFRASTLSVDWLPDEEDGLVVYQADSGALVFENYATGENDTFVAAENIPEDVYEYWIRSDQEKVLFATNYTQNYRHSYWSNYIVLDVASGEQTPLVDDQNGDIQYAQLAPTGDLIAFVRDNNLYIKDGVTGEISQITNDGGEDMFHGVPDWVYEEEIFGDRSALWFSPDARFLSFLSFNESGVGTFTVQYFMNDSDIAPVYSQNLDIRYPKVGTTNPTVAITLLDLATLDLLPISTDAFSPEELIIGEVSWVTDTHESLIYRAYNRVQTEEKLVTVSVPSVSSKINRERDGSDGWLENGLNIQYVGQLRGNGTYSNANTTYYLDVSDASGWAHIYLFPVNGPASSNITLTSGEWEVRSVLSVDTQRQLVYYTSTERDSTESHLYSVSYATLEKKALVDDSEAGWWSASFSSNNGYYLLNYGGPNVPYQELYAVNSSTPISTVTSNQALVDKLQTYNLPNTTWTQIGPVPDTDYMLNVKVTYPPNFDPSKKYPIMFTPYGGPNSQRATKAYTNYNWNLFVAANPELQYILYTIDNRGGAFQGREFRSTVTEQLGILEAKDQIWAANYLIENNDFIDSNHVALWGWSFGGFLTAKVLETQGADAGPFTLGLITAPVTDWRFYDSMYTERYMRVPETNAAGYEATAIRDTQGFKSVLGGFSIQHGIGDDNVHYQHTAALVDLLVGDGVSPEKMSWRAYTDSDHSIAYNGANVDLYKYLSGLLYKEKLRETGLVEQHGWSKRDVVDFN